MPYPDKNGYYGKFGGRFVSELLIPALDQLTTSYKFYRKDKKFQCQISKLLGEYAGRPTHLYFAPNLSQKWKSKIYLKREDMLHTGAHKINNTIGQVTLAKMMGKKRIIAETGAGQHGVATATICAYYNIACVVYMGQEDMRRQALNVFRMQLLGAEVRAAGGKMGTLRHAVNEALRDWATNIDNTAYVLGSVVGPHPFPMIVRDFQIIIGKETRKQILKVEGKLPNAIIACVGGGSNAMGMFHPFRKDCDKIELIGVEAAGKGLSQQGKHSATISKGFPGVLHGTYSYLLQSKEGFVSDVHSVSAGLDYPSVGPEHAYFNDAKIAQYKSATDEEALLAFQELSKTEGIIPALESSHALAYAKKYARKNKNATIIINLSGRGDKDASEAQKIISQSLRKVT